MPIYEYSCRGCGARFEHLARSLNEAPPPCPSCGKARPEKQFSVFSAVESSKPGRLPCASGACPGAAKSGSCASGRCPHL